jgi:nitric oxide reductase large subunit
MIPLTGIEKSFTISDFWRWWVVHLWVEQSFEFFAAAISAYLLMAVGLVSRQLAERSVYFELILIFLGGVLGTGHHLYWAGEPGLWVPMGSMFSFIEVLPLVLLVIEAIQHHRLIKADPRAMLPPTGIRIARGSGGGPSGSTIAAWSCGSSSTSSRSAGRNSMPCSSTGSLMREAAQSTTRRSSGNGCASRAT